MLNPLYAMSNGQPPTGGFPAGNVTGDSNCTTVPFSAKPAATPSVATVAFCAVKFARTTSGLPGRKPAS